MMVRGKELFFICATFVTIYPPTEFQITIQTRNNCPSPLRAVAMQYNEMQHQHKLQDEGGYGADS